MISGNSTSSRRGPLAEYAITAGSPILRELAQLAIIRGHTQQSLARALRVEASHVVSYFSTKNPHQKTLSRLADCLGMDDQHVRLVQHLQLGADELSDAESDVIHEVKRSSRFTADATVAIREALNGAPQEIRTRALAAYLLANHRAEIGLTPRPQRPGISGALRAFADALGDRFDLPSILRSGDQREFLLLEMYLMLTNRFDFAHDTAESILAVLRPALHLANCSVDRMDEVLHSSREYRGGVFQMKLLSNTNKRRSTKKASKDEQS